MGGGVGGVKRKECTREADWNVPRRDRERETEEKKAKGKRTKLFEGMAVVSSVLVSQVHHRRNVLCCDDSIVLKPSMI